MLALFAFSTQGQTPTSTSDITFSEPTVAFQEGKPVLQYIVSKPITLESLGAEMEELDKKIEEAIQRKNQIKAIIREILQKKKDEKQAADPTPQPGN